LRNCVGAAHKPPVPHGRATPAPRSFALPLRRDSQVSCHADDAGIVSATAAAAIALCAILRRSAALRHPPTFAPPANVHHAFFRHAAAPMQQLSRGAKITISESAQFSKASAAIALYLLFYHNPATLQAQMHRLRIMSKFPK
jgi:hypothetical protein